MLRVVSISDTHNMHEQIELPEGDLIIHCGDFSSEGSKSEFSSFLNWFKKLNFKYKILVPGNHDKYLEKYQYEDLKRFEEIGINILISRKLEIEKYNFFGFPYVPYCGDWAFTYRLWNYKIVAPVFSLDIPNELDVLICHGGPYKKLDRCKDGSEVGCKYLAQRIKETNPRYCIFGHIHESNGIIEEEDTTFINCSICNEYYEPVNKPFVFDLF